MLIVVMIATISGCSDFQFRSKTGSILCGRTMDFLMPMSSQVIVFNRGVNMSSVAPDGLKGLQWKSKYGFVGINAFGINLVDEGMNEKGLTCGFLVLDDSIYPPIDPSKNNVSLAIMDFCMWILSSFQTTSEVLSEINGVRVWGNRLPVLNIVMGLHVPIHDAFGNNLVIEFIEGEVKIYDNVLGILTNDPPLPYQLLNLAQNTHLSPNVTSTTTINNYTFTNTHSSGMHALPGGWTPMDRFVRIATLLRFATETSAQQQFDGLLIATHILDSVYVINGLEIAYFSQFRRYVYGKTLWSTIKDLTNRVFYFRNSDNVIRAIYLDKLNFNPDAKHNSILVQKAKPFILDETKSLFPYL